MLCAIWYHLHNLKNVKNTHGGVLLLVKSQALAFNFTKSNTPPWVSFYVLKIMQMVQNRAKLLIFSNYDPETFHFEYNAHAEKLLHLFFSKSQLQNSGKYGNT